MFFTAIFLAAATLTNPSTESAPAAVVKSEVRYRVADAHTAYVTFRGGASVADMPVDLAERLGAAVLTATCEVRDGVLTLRAGSRRALDLAWAFVRAAYAPNGQCSNCVGFTY